MEGKFMIALTRCTRIFNDKKTFSYTYGWHLNMFEKNIGKFCPWNKCVIRLVEIAIKKGTRSIRPTSIPRDLFALQEVPKTQLVYKLHNVAFSFPVNSSFYGGKDFSWQLCCGRVWLLCYLYYQQFLWNISRLMTSLPPSVFTLSFLTMVTKSDSRRTLFFRLRLQSEVG